MRPRHALPPLVVLVLALCALAAPAGAAERGASVPVLDWRDCDGGFQCATAEVPRDYARPHGPTVELALIRHPAVDPEHRIGTLFLNFGGPGVPGVDAVRAAPPVAFQAVSKFDVVGFDPRGTGASRPAVDCDELSEPLELMTPETYDRRELVRRGRILARLCQNQDPAFLASLTTANAARDLDLLRAAVGDRKLTYIGISWGGMIGETYASLFPGRARALLLDSPVEGDVWLNRPFRAAHEQNSGFEASLDRFFDACAEECESGGAAPEDAYDDLLARLDATPVDLGEGRAFDDLSLRLITAEFLYSKQGWRPLAATLVAAENRDAAFLRAVADGVIGEQYDLLYDVFETYVNVERRYPRRIAPYVDNAEREFAAAPHFAFGAYESASSAFWSVQPRSAFYGPYRHPGRATPALVMHTTHDPATPYAWGKRVVRDLGNARLLTYRGDGHGVITTLDPCVLPIMVAYLERGDLPPVGASCEQDVPFPAAAGRPTAARAASGSRPAWARPTASAWGPASAPASGWPWGPE